MREAQVGSAVHLTDDSTSDHCSGIPYWDGETEAISQWARKGLEFGSTALM